ncbi:MAG: T9SS C-terminal target domain-containing protein [Cryomorphaceae bacterium]|nr:MAG: T9SS C-terminal target domain-containing protein [Cryomorphaceae bacterium]
MNTISHTTTQHRLEVSLETSQTLTVLYQPQTERALFDLCDLNGRILVTGEIKQNRTRVDVTDLYPDQYILLILDGDKVCSTKFSIEG